MKIIATGLLVAMACLFLTARLLEPQFSWLSFVAAFAEAAMVGALADWFAVTALFRSPLGLPIPHTAIIARNKDRIGSSIADFLENNFLTQDVIASELQLVDFAGAAGRWLSEPTKRRPIIGLLLLWLPLVLHSIDESKGADFLKNRVASLLANTRLAPFAADILATLVADNRHHQVFDLMLQFGRKTLDNNRAMIRQKIHERSPRWIPQSVDERFFVGLLEELEEFLQQMSLPESQWRLQFQESVDELIEKLRSSPEFESAIATFAAQAANHPVVGEYSLRIWRDVKEKLLADMQAEDSYCARQIDCSLQTFAALLVDNKNAGEKLNSWLRGVATGFIVARRAMIASLVRRVIQSWDGETVSRKFELYIGSDLQYIRINGTIVGGLAGLMLHLVSLTLN